MLDVKAVLFDCDGLMFETELISQQIWKDEANKLGFSLPEDFFINITGSGGEELTRYLSSIPKGIHLFEVMKKKRFDISFWSSIQKDCLNKKGLVTLFHWLKQHGYLIGICSSSHRTYVEALLSTVSTPLEYDAIVGGDMVTHAKPDPEIFLVGAKILGVKPSDCLVLEDSKQGITAAKRAGMHSCFIEDTIKPDQIMKDMIEYQTENLEDVIQLLKNQ
jgi:HAD hydrolase, family IA, variant 3